MVHYIIINVSDSTDERRTLKNVSSEEVFSIHNSSNSSGISEISWQARLTNVPYICYRNYFIETIF